MIIAIDFDGTCVTHEFPKIGKEIGAVSVLQQLVKKGHQLILFTMRSDIKAPNSEHPKISIIPGEYLTESLEWFKKHEIPLWGIQTNPEQSTWTHSPKAYAEMYIDDDAFGCPLILDKDISDRPFVDWITIENHFQTIGLI